MARCLPLRLFNRTVSTAALALLCAMGTAPWAAQRAWAMPPHSPQAQAKKPVERTALGTVVNNSGAPIDKAVVYLQDDRTQVIRSYVTVNGGQFHFNQLSPDTDYDVWAEVNKHRSKKKTISMFSSHMKFTYKLKIKS